jgi:hypothetical protein
MIIKVNDNPDVGNSAPGNQVYSELEYNFAFIFKKEDQFH